MLDRLLLQLLCRGSCCCVSSQVAVLQLRDCLSSHLCSSNNSSWCYSYDGLCDGHDDGHDDVSYNRASHTISSRGTSYSIYRILDVDVDDLYIYHSIYHDGILVDHI